MSPARSPVAGMPTRRASGALNVLAALLESRTGQQIAANREWRVETALKPILRERGLETLEELVGEILDGRDKAVGDIVVDALLNQESSFFRDAAVIDLLADAAARIYAETGRRVRIWSAGCSTGQEPLSLAMLLTERFEAGGPPVPEIVATDVSDIALARARAGVFSQFEIQRGLPIRRMMRWFDNVDGDWIARPELVRQISFRQGNLVADPLPVGRFDLILCRNVLMYLSPVLRRQVLDRFGTAMRPGGLLALGAGETVIGQTETFRPSPEFRGLYEPSCIADARGAALG